MLSPISDRETAALMRLGSAGFFDGSELSLLLRPHDGAAGGPALPPLSALRNYGASAFERAVVVPSAPSGTVWSAAR